jgi:hypothetical protein
MDRSPSGDPIASIHGRTVVRPITAIVVGGAVVWSVVAAIATIGIGWVAIAIGVRWVTIAIRIGWVVAVGIGWTR